MTSPQAKHSDLEPSALTQLIESAAASDNHFAATTLQVLHNLQYQHLWTSLQIHDISKNSTSVPTDSGHQGSMSPDAPPALISGIPPHRVYTHPDEQLYMLAQGIAEDDLRPERVFVIPTAQGQPWSLRRMAGAFDALAALEGAESEEAMSSSESVDPEKAKKLDEYYARKGRARETKEWGTRRALLAMTNRGMGGEGTVVYYVVQEGEVKPRQN